MRDSSSGTKCNKIDYHNFTNHLTSHTNDTIHITEKIIHSAPLARLLQRIFLYPRRAKAVPTLQDGTVFQYRCL